MSRIERILRKVLPFKEIGWEDIGERFTRYQIFKTPWFNLYLHQLDAPNWHPQCHDHPWWFVTLILRKGYVEKIGNDSLLYHRHPVTILYRPACFSHNVVTPWGTAWSLVLTGPKSREWGFQDCPQ